MRKNKKVLVGMSGGVDSAMALFLLKKQGFEPFGITLKLPVWEDKENLLRENICCTQESINAAKKICQLLKIPYCLIDVQEEFRKLVIDYFLKELKKGKTPNPCMICNRYLKFKKLFELAKKEKIYYLATGHYARVFAKKEAQEKIYYLAKAKDKIKDQTYNLALLPQKWLKRIIFPLGNFKKAEIKKMAQKEGFDFLLTKKESQDFCFVAGKSLQKFLEKKLGKKEGLIKDTQGNILGKHKGLYFYTIGQRKGINLPKGPYYVKKIDLKKNVLFVTKDEKEIFERKVFLTNLHFISKRPKQKILKVKAKIRATAKEAKAKLFLISPKKGYLVFERAQKAPTPGQFGVFYLKNICLGAGKII